MVSTAALGSIGHVLVGTRAPYTLANKTPPLVSSTAVRSGTADALMLARGGRSNASHIALPLMLMLLSSVHVCALKAKKQAMVAAEAEAKRKVCSPRARTWL